jgi:hypothetical protein
MIRGYGQKFMDGGCWRRFIEETVRGIGCWLFEEWIYD